ncbi:Hypothetical predicted protein [Podarcis lilfordi]|uniref:Uncharacterized protein n=1 Tax=Podarcis lilfordi TaxID=74358 RepID=A0AA35KJ49_9SAUR|nr:Hypothetical predicted protein [Podarcis lilfordi]
MEAYGPGRRRCRLPYFCCRFPHPSLKIPPKKRRRFTKSFGPLSHGKLSDQLMIVGFHLLTCPFCCIA